MKRDMDFIRNILLDVEAGKMQTRYEELIGKTDEENGLELDKLRYHYKLIADAGFVTCIKDLSLGQVPIDLTWLGCDFVDTIRDDDVWRKTKSGASKAAGAGFGFIVELAKGYAKAELQKLGLPLS
ncbi:DUF2513 domain-containing protein [Methylobacterium sp. J-077]|uniref:DUF2513 domain-containing protein n=1 Tax=Methylobacterium sp. J-077 TaxID=2836656 RepID=UPI001FB9F35C|nr:DUF2513 domain-containing protein [Methylobacterium sp. J-077]MCJ2126789.1 DUF2513 domain-containing protein [Methylobacterium sp. J-077]